MIDYAVEICKHCLQTDSASGGLCHPRDYLPGFAHDEHQNPWAIALPNENSWFRHRSSVILVRNSSLCSKMFKS